MLNYPFTIRNLKILQAIAEYGNFTEAAQNLYVSQPAISAQIRELEQLLNTKLIERNRTGARFTEAGYVLLYYANQILSLCDEAYKALEDLQMYPHSTFTLGGSQTMGLKILPSLLEFFQKQYPTTHINIHIDATSHICWNLINGGIDIAIVGGIIPPSTKKKLQANLFGKEEVILVVSPKNKYAKTAILEKQTLYDLHLICLEKQSSTQQHIANELNLSGINCADLVVDMEVNSIETVKQCLLNSDKAALLPFSSVVQELCAGELHWLPVKTLRIIRPIWLITNPYKYQLRVIDLFLKTCSKNFVNPTIERF